MLLVLNEDVRQFGLSEAEFRVLTTLFAEPEGSAHPTDLSIRTSQAAANMSRISDALVRRELITRVASVRDRRMIELRVTDHGEELVRRAMPSLCISLRRLFDEFSEGQLQDLTTRLKLLAAKLGERATDQIVAGRLEMGSHDDANGDI